MKHKMTLPTYGYKQITAWHCGPAIARVLLYCHNTEMDIKDVVKELKTTRGGTSDSNLLRLLRRKGIKFRVKKHASLKALARLLKNNWVVVAYYIPRRAKRKEELHYSIVTRVTKKRIYFHDTWYGANHSYSIAYFLKNWHNKSAEGWMLSVKK